MFGAADMARIKQGFTEERTRRDHAVPACTSCPHRASLRDGRHAGQLLDAIWEDAQNGTSMPERSTANWTLRDGRIAGVELDFHAWERTDRRSVRRPAPVYQQTLAGHVS